MAQENWKKVTDRYFSDAEKEEWASRMPALPEGFDMNAYNRQWTELAGRIEAALPLDPKSDAARHARPCALTLAKYTNAAEYTLGLKSRGRLNRMQGGGQAEAERGRASKSSPDRPPPPIREKRKDRPEGSIIGPISVPVALISAPSRTLCVQPPCRPRSSR